MATDIVQSLFGVTPDSYQQAQQDRADAQAMRFAQLDPFQQANYAIGRGAYGLAGAVGGALGGQDPELQRISMRQQIAGQLNPNDLTTFDRGIEIMQRANDGQGAYMLQMEADKIRQQALVRSDEALVRQDAARKRAAEIASLARQQEAQNIAQGAFRPSEAKYYGESTQRTLRDDEGNLMPGAGVSKPSFDIQSVAPQLIRTPEGRAQLESLNKAASSLRPEYKDIGGVLFEVPRYGDGPPTRVDQPLINKANQLVSQIRNTDGTLNQGIVDQLRSFPQGIAAIAAQAKIIPDLRKLGATATPEVDPFAVFTADATIPKNVKTLAQQYSKSFASGILDPEKADARVKELTDMTQRVQQFEQNQDQIKSNQEIMQSLRKQGLENSQQALLIQQGNQALQAQNIQFQQDMRRKEAEVKAEAKANKPLPSYLAKEEDADFSAANAATNIATDAYGYINRIKTGEIKFGLKEKASIRARQLFGSGDPDVIAREEYDKFVTNLVNESLRLNKGTQTEGDAVREAKALQSSESKEAAASAMKRLVEINTRRAEGAASSVEKRRANAGFPSAPQPISVPKFDVQIITPAEYNSFLKNPKFPRGTVFVDPDGVRRVKP